MWSPPRWAVAIITVLVVVMIVAVARARESERVLTGMWAGDPAFLDLAGLTQMRLYISPKDDGARQAYLLMADEEGNVVYNQGLEIRYRVGPMQWASAAAIQYGSYKIRDAEFDFDKPGVMPDRMDLGMNVVEGTLTLHKDGKIYAFLVRDNEASMQANDQYEDEVTN